VTVGVVKSEDDQENEGVETITKSKATCKKKCQKKHAKEVSKQARDIEKNHTWHDDGAVVESTADCARD